MINERVYLLGIQRLALFGALLGVFSEMHPFCDQWVQGGQDAIHKGAHGGHLVYADGVAVGAEPEGEDRTGRPTMTATRLGRTCAARHVASYTVVQVASTVAVTRALGYRVPARALLAGAAINAATHAVIDRREPLMKLAKIARKTGYIDHCKAVRIAEDGTVSAVASGPGSALMELDQALHRAIGVGAAVVTAWLATRRGGK